MQQLADEGRVSQESINNAGWWKTLAAPRLSHWTLLHVYLSVCPSICLRLPDFLPSCQDLSAFLFPTHRSAFPMVSRLASHVHVSLSCWRWISLQLQCFFSAALKKELCSQLPKYEKEKSIKNQSDVIECSDAERNQQQSQQPPLLRTPAE